MPTPASDQIDSSYSWIRLLLSITLAAISSVGIWAIVVIIPALQDDFGSSRGGTSFAYTTTMIGFAIGNGVAGRFVDRYGITPVAIVSAVLICIGFVLCSFATSVWMMALVCILIGLGSSASFGPLIGDISHWFERRRGFAVAATASGNYLAGAIWPFFINSFEQSVGWRSTYLGIGIFCLITMIPLALLLRRRPVIDTADDTERTDAARAALSKRTLQTLLVIAGVACCVAMSMPQVHIVAYSDDLGFGVTHGAHMLGLMLAGGVISRLGFGFISDYLGGMRTCLLASLMQCLALMLFLPTSSLTALYIVSFIFGMAQGGIVPSYAVIVRELLPAREAAERIGLIMMATVAGMALGGWMTGWIHDLTGDYSLAFMNGIAWNVFNLAVVGWLFMRTRPRMSLA